MTPHGNMAERNVASHSIKYPFTHAAKSVIQY